MVSLCTLHEHPARSSLADSASGWVANQAAALRVLADFASCGWVANRAAAPHVLADSASCEWVVARGGSPPRACGFRETRVGSHPQCLLQFVCDFRLAGQPSCPPSLEWVVGSGGRNASFTAKQRLMESSNSGRVMICSTVPLFRLQT